METQKKQKQKEIDHDIVESTLQRKVEMDYQVLLNSKKLCMYYLTYF